MHVEIAAKVRLARAKYAVKHHQTICWHNACAANRLHFGSQKCSKFGTNVADNVNKNHQGHQRQK